MVDRNVLVLRAEDVRHGDQNLVARSQAKRLLALIGDAKHVSLDLSEVEAIGPSFADEIFRVFANEHPQVQIDWVNANESVEKMIRGAKSTL